QDTLDSALAGERVDVQRLQFGEDGSGLGEAVAGSRRGVSLQPTADGEHGPLQLGRDALGDVMVGPGQVVKPFRPDLQVTAPPLAEPAVGSGDGGADSLDGSAGQAQGDSSMTSVEFVVHGCLRVAAAGGCPRRSFYARAKHREP